MLDFRNPHRGGGFPTGRRRASGPDEPRPLLRDKTGLTWAEVPGLDQPPDGVDEGLP
jgi:hypothetical protein